MNLDPVQISHAGRVYHSPTDNDIPNFVSDEDLPPSIVIHDFKGQNPEETLARNPTYPVASLRPNIDQRRTRKFINKRNNIMGKSCLNKSSKLVTIILLITTLAYAIYEMSMIRVGLDKNFMSSFDEVDYINLSPENKKIFTNLSIASRTYGAESRSESSVTYPLFCVVIVNTIFLHLAHVINFKKAKPLRAYTPIVGGATITFGYLSISAGYYISGPFAMLYGTWTILKSIPPNKKFIACCGKINLGAHRLAHKISNCFTKCFCKCFDKATSQNVVVNVTRASRPGQAETA